MSQKGAVSVPGNHHKGREILYALPPHASPCLPKAPYDFLCVPMDPYGTLWLPMDPYGSLMLPMAVGKITIHRRK